MHKLISLSYHGAPLWAFAAVAAILIGEYLLGKYHPKSKSTLALVGAGLKLAAYGAAFLLSKFPPTAIVGEFLKSILVPMLIVGVCLSISGCATVDSKPGDTMGQKFATDVAAFKGVAEDVKAQCGSQFASLAPVLAAALAIAADPYNVFGDVTAIAQSYAPVAADIKAVECVVRVVMADLKALRPKPPALPAPTEATEVAP